MKLQQTVKNIIRQPAARWGATVIYAALIAILSLMPGKAAARIALPIPYFDKWAHGIMHGLFALLICWAMQAKLHRKIWLLAALAACIVYGVLMELGQFHLTMDRTFSWGDIAANTVGAALATMLFAAFQQTPDGARNQAWGKTMGKFKKNNNNSIITIIDQLAQFANSRTAMIWNDQPYTYGDLRNRIKDYIQTLQSTGIKPGATVCIESDFSPDSIALFFALAARNCILIPITAARKNEKDRIMQIAQAEYRITFPPKNIRKTKRDGLDGDKNSPGNPGGSGNELFIQSTGIRAMHRLYERPRQLQHPGLVLFSSGSTGEPKGIVHDLQVLCERFVKPRKPYRAIAFLMFDHIGGVNTMFYLLSSGGCMVMIPDRKPETVLAAIEKQKVELLPTSPTFLNMILASEAYNDYDLSSLKIISYGAEPMPESTLHRIHELFPTVRLQQTYGMSEVGILSTKSKASDSLWLQAGGEGYETKVVDGILHIRAKTAMLGYLNAPSPFTADGWLNTGDAVETDGEHIRFLGRRDEQINVGGEKVSPHEVESVLEELDKIKQAVVFGEPNPLMGMIVCARIVPADGNHNNPAALRKLVRRHCEQRLPRHKVPVRIELAEEIQHTVSFKKKRWSRPAPDDNG